MASRYVAYGVGHGEHGEAEGERYADEADTEIWESRRQDGASSQRRRNLEPGHAPFVFISRNAMPLLTSSHVYTHTVQE
jgi:hypothetical protein